MATDIVRTSLEVSDLTSLKGFREWIKTAQRFIPIAVGDTTLSTGGGSEAVTVTGAKTTDTVIVSIKTDDSGTSIINLKASISAANTLTIIRTDDGSSSDDAVATWAVYRTEG